MADLLDEAGMDGSAPPNVCPGCRTVIPQGAIVCIHCGYNQKLGRKTETEAAPAGPPPTRPVSGAPSFTLRTAAVGQLFLQGGVLLLERAVTITPLGSSVVGANYLQLRNKRGVLLGEGDQHFLNIDPDSPLRASAIGESGIYYGVKTLQQMLEGRLGQDKLTVPIVRVLDWPDLAERGQWGGSSTRDIQYLADRKNPTGARVRTLNNVPPARGQECRVQRSGTRLNCGRFCALRIERYRKDQRPSARHNIPYGKMGICRDGSNKRRIVDAQRYYQPREKCAMVVKFPG